MWAQGRTRDFLLGSILGLLACRVRWSLGTLLMQQDTSCNLDNGQTPTITDAPWFSPFRSPQSKRWGSVTDSTLQFGAKLVVLWLEKGNWCLFISCAFNAAFDLYDQLSYMQRWDSACSECGLVYPKGMIQSNIHRGVRRRRMPDPSATRRRHG